MPLVILFRALLVLFLFRIVFRFVSGLLAGFRGPAAERQAPPAGVPMVRDHVCNTFVPRSRALTAAVNGQEEYFCSDRCRQRALADVSSGIRRGVQS
jgi:YHS domain-containing protein